MLRVRDAGAWLAVDRFQAQQPHQPPHPVPTNRHPLARPFLSTLQLFRDVQLLLLSLRLLVRLLRQLQQLLYLPLQLLLQLVRMPPAHRFVLARVPLHLRPIQAHPSQPQRAQLRCHLQYLLEQPLQLAQKPLPEIRYRVMVRMLVSGYVAKRHRVIRRLLQLAARKHSRLTVESRGESSHGSWRLESESLALTYFVDGSRRLTTVQVTELTRRRLCWRGGAPADAYDLTAGADTVCWVRA